MARVRSFRVPKDGPVFFDAIVERSHKLIQHGIWEGLHITKLRTWLANFQTDEERYFAACVLDSLIYRSHEQTVALTNQLFQRILPDLLRLDPPPVHSASLDRLRQEIAILDPGVRLVPVVTDNNPPTKSGYIVARLLRRHLRISDRWIIQPHTVGEHIAAGVRVFLFIDDFLGTGQEFEDFASWVRLGNHLPQIYGAYLPLVAHERGIENLRNKFSDLRIRPVEILDVSNNLFDSTAHCFDDGINTSEAAKLFYYDLLMRKGIHIPSEHACGYGNLGLVYGFSHAVPDNSLPILWWSKTPGWTPLFAR